METIVFVDKPQLTDTQLEQLKKAGKLIIATSLWPKEDEVLQLISRATIIVSKWIPITRKLLDHSPHLKYIVMALTGYQDWIDAEAAVEKKIIISNVPAFSSQAVAEHSILLMLSLFRNLVPAHNDLTNRGRFDPKDLQGQELAGKTLGIIGYGNIGKRLGQLARCFDMKVISVNSGSTKADLNNLLKRSDFLSINVPLTPLTETMIGEKELSLLPKGAVVINTSRGKVIDEKALIKYLRNGHLLGAGLDVFAQEPPDKDNPLFKLLNVVVTPHIAYNTKEAYLRLMEGVIENLEAFVKGKPINRVI